MRVTPSEIFSTYSIVARDAQTHQLGVAVQTHQMCVGQIVPWLHSGLGAIATQSLANVSFGPIGLEMLREGLSASQVLDGLIASDPQANRRQVAVVDAQGNAAAHTGSGCIAEAAHHTGKGYSVQANMMTHTSVVSAMARAYEQTAGDLGQRMLCALQAAQEEGGDIRGMQSAALVIVPGDASQPRWQYDYNLRVDEHAEPVTELARLVRLRRAQLLDNQGYKALEAGERKQALALWANARETAPELEELPFWQAITLADNHDDMETAVTLLREAFDQDARRDHWYDLINRLEACGLIEREGIAGLLLQALHK